VSGHLEEQRCYLPPERNTRQCSDRLRRAFQARATHLHVLVFNQTTSIHKQRKTQTHKRTKVKQHKWTQIMDEQASNWLHTGHRCQQHMSAAS